MQSLPGYGFLLKAPQQYYEAEYQELKGSVEKICQYAENECKKAGISNINFAIYVKESTFITIGIKNNMAEFALFDNASSSLIQECSIYDFKKYVTEQRLDLFMCRIEKECKAVKRGQVLDRRKLDDVWNNKLVNSHVKEQDTRTNSSVRKIQVNVTEIDFGIKMDETFYLVVQDKIIGKGGISKMPNTNEVFLEWIELLPQFRDRHLLRPSLIAIGDYYKSNSLLMESSSENISKYEHLGAIKLACDDFREMQSYKIDVELLRKQQLRQHRTISR